MTVEGYNQRLVAAANRLRKAQEDYLKAIEEASTAERLYKLGTATALLQIDEYRNADERAAKAEILPIELAASPGAPREWVTVNALRYAAHLADGKRDAAKQAVANFRDEMGSLRSLMSLEKAEADFAKWAPSEAVGT